MQRHTSSTAHGPKDLHARKKQAFKTVLGPQNEEIIRRIQAGPRLDMDTKLWPKSISRLKQDEVAAGLLDMRATHVLFRAFIEAHAGRQEQEGEKTLLGLNAELQAVVKEMTGKYKQRTDRSDGTIWTVFARTSLVLATSIAIGKLMESGKGGTFKTEDDGRFKYAIGDIPKMAVLGYSLYPSLFYDP